uniref:G patch domain-containing protein 11 n=2 Tax=Hirondellea gigas TaxID=1518452 RepID=A0A2P2I8Y9_9CRUS
MWRPPRYDEADQYGDDDDAGQEDEDDDYMSDAFIAKCASSSSSVGDIRPGMPMSYSRKRALQLEKKKQQLRAEKKLLKSKKVTQKMRMDEGLSTAIGAENKGFAMLQKMGYKPGTSLGKEGSGRLEPIRMELKFDRGGLGLKEQLMERKREKERRYLANIKKKNQEFDPNKYRELKRQQLMAKQMLSDLHQCQRTCRSLDSDEGLTEPMEWYFWPTSYRKEHEQEEASGHDEYTQEQHGGDSEECVVGSNSEKPKDGSSGDCWNEEQDDGWLNAYSWDDQEKMEPWQVEIQVDLVSTYLRTSYNYCIWCGTAYDDQTDLQRSCPGTTRQDHDD